MKVPTGIALGNIAQTFEIRNARRDARQRFVRSVLTRIPFIAARSGKSRLRSLLLAGEASLVAVQSDERLVGMTTVHVTLFSIDPTAVGRLTARGCDRDARGRGIGPRPWFSRRGEPLANRGCRTGETHSAIV